MVLSLVGRIKGGQISSAGLRIVILEISEVECSNIVVKSGLRSLTRTPIKSIPSSTSSSSVIIDCFLKSCHFCKKPLSPDKDVYMYRGDEGFCSIECRNRQIMVDEMKEMEVKTKKRLATSTAASIDCAGCETCNFVSYWRTFDDVDITVTTSLNH